MIQVSNKNMEVNPRALIYQMLVWVELWGCYVAHWSNMCDLCVTLPLRRSETSVMSEENQMPAEGANDCSAANSTQCVDAECALWHGTTINKRWECFHCCLSVNVLIWFNRHECLHNTLALPLAFSGILPSHTHTHTHTDTQLLMSRPLDTALDSLPPCKLPAPDPLIHPPPHGPHSWCRAYTM